jgi:hypothetical protein
LLLLSHCKKKEVMLPVIPIDGIEQTENHSSIWIFLELSEGDTLAILNKNNKLINTNWIFNVDRRLKMKHVIPHLETLQRDRNKDSMHKKEGMSNFFSYADTKNERISLVEFPEQKFVLKSDTEVFMDRAPDSICRIPLQLEEDLIMVNGNKYRFDEMTRIGEILESCDSISQPRFQLQYGPELTFQQYLSARASLASSDLPVDNTELIHTLK